ncbi:MAG: NAD(P)H-binding protein [Burkholderiaceae bacterium]|nr:NAD(P)H-binding protein [Burkholderiaceae bacterium]
MTNPVPQRLWLAGATGLIGREVLDLALQNRCEVHALLRRAAPELPNSPHLHAHQVDFAAPTLGLSSPLPAADALIICLGTTIKVAGSQEAFRALDFGAVLAVAKLARDAGVSRCAVVSALGADPASGVFYNRVKGEMEQALMALNFPQLLIARPSLLVGDRARLGQPARAGEQWAERLSRPLRGLIPARWRPITASAVARALWLGVTNESGPRLRILESDQLQALAGTQAC